MILYFSGTGNSEYVAQKIGRTINDEVFDLFAKIRSDDFSPLRAERPWVVVTPTYAWRIPRIVQHWLENTAFTGSEKIYFVMTCGGGIGNAEKYLKKLSASKFLRYMGCYEIVMPENYIALFTTPTREQAAEIIRKADEEIVNAAELIGNGETFPTRTHTWRDKISSGIVNDMFYPLFVHAKKFYATDACISCGKCVKVCPTKNVRLADERPEWGDKCTHCMACICRCPAAAIEYGKHSVGLPRYTCPRVSEND